MRHGSAGSARYSRLESARPILVQASLNVNGYFTVVEYPVLEAYRGTAARSVTDLDVLAMPFSGAGHEVIRGQSHRPMDGRVFEADPVLGCAADRPDTIVGEVKEGSARQSSTRGDWCRSAPT